MVLYQHGISSPEPLKWLLSNLRNSSSCLCVRQYCSSSHMSPNYPRMVFAFFSFLWSSTCCGFSANTICMPDHEVIFFFLKAFVRLLLCVTSSQALHLGLLWGDNHAMPGIYVQSFSLQHQEPWLELESPSSCSVLVCLSWKDPLSFGSTLYFFRAHKQFKETYGKGCHFPHCLVSCSFLHP